MQIDYVLLLLAVVLIIAMTTWAFVLRPYRSTRDLVDTVESLSEQVKDTNGRIRELETEGAIQRGMVRQVESKLIDLQYDFSELRAGATRLTQQIMEFGGVPVWQMPRKFDRWVTSAMTAGQNIKKAYQVIGESFGEDEIRELAFELGVEYENIGGGTKRAKAQGLVELAERSGRLGELIELAKTKRPLIDWLGL